MKNFTFVCGIGDAYYHASIKPLVDISYGLIENRLDPTLLIHEQNSAIKKEIMEITNGKLKIEIYNRNTISNIIKEISPDYIITDDYLVNMETVMKNKTPKSKIIIYSQILYGISTLNPSIRKKSKLYSTGSMVPWRMLIRRYRKTISKADYIVSNSLTSKFLLQQLYGINSDTVVYPPVGVPLRKFVMSSDNKERSGLFVFMGRNLDYFSRNLLNEILNFKNLTGEPVRVLLKDERLSKVFRDNEIETYASVNSEMLAHLYSSSRLTYVPTMTEMFGYVGAESIMFKTPVLLDTYHPFIEMIPNWSKSVFISYPKETLSESYLRIMKDLDKFSIDNSEILNIYSASSSANSLEQMVNNE